MKRHFQTLIACVLLVSCGACTESRETDSPAAERERPAIGATAGNGPACPAAESRDAWATEGQSSGAGRNASAKTWILPGGAEMEMAWCPPGSFRMGSPEGEEGRDGDETRHLVTLSRGFWMARTEVTQKQWTSVMEDNPSCHQGEDLPVENVGWDECVAFCRKAGLQLPTEAEWEYACRAGSDAAYAGTGSLDDMGWHDGNAGSMTHPVGEKNPNAWGFFDMHGNVSEWCADWYGAYPDGPAEDPEGAESGDYRVLRGGNCGFDAPSCRSAARDGDFPGSGSWGIGFRPVFR